MPEFTDVTTLDYEPVVASFCIHDKLAEGSDPSWLYFYGSLQNVTEEPLYTKLTIYDVA